MNKPRDLAIDVGDRPTKPVTALSKSQKLRHMHCEGGRLQGYLGIGLVDLGGFRGTR
jgi:hypothetical protein